MSFAWKDFPLQYTDEEIAHVIMFCTENYGDN